MLRVHEVGEGRLMCSCKKGMSAHQIHLMLGIGYEAAI